MSADGMLAVGAVGILGAGLAALWWLSLDSHAPVVALGPEDPGAIARKKAGAPQTQKPVAHATVPSQLDMVRVLEVTAAKLAAPSATTAASRALTTVGMIATSAGADPFGATPAALQSGAVQLNLGGGSGALETPEIAGSGVSPLSKLGNLVGGKLADAGAALGQVTPLAGVFLVNAFLDGFRGASDKVQAAILGNESVQALGTGLSAVPVVGPLIGVGLKALAGTYEGQRVVKAVGTAEEQGYNAQKQLVAGQVSQAFSGGGSSSAERKAAEAKAIADARAVALRASAALGGRGVLGPGGETVVNYSAAVLVTKLQAQKNAATDKANTVAQAKVQASAAVWATKGPGGWAGPVAPPLVTIPNPDYVRPPVFGADQRFMNQRQETIQVPADDPRAQPKKPKVRPVVAVVPVVAPRPAFGQGVLGF